MKAVNAVVKRALWLGMVLTLAWGAALAQATDDDPINLATVSALQRQAQSLNLAHRREWQLLLHRPLDGGESQIVDQDFFLDPEGRRDPAAELQATLLALSQPVPADDPDRHPRCRYPARHLWLLSALGLPSTLQPDVRCRAIRRWVDLDDIRSLQVILVSGYFGNPASAFGHSLIRISTHGNAASGGLGDVGINFGALVPAQENPLLYIYRGITGKYAAGFTEREFLEHDRVYARTENRDFWTYDLRLSKAQQWLVVSHMWELVGRRFTYYFFSQNCGWRMAELLELALPGPLRRASGDPWFIPVELVQRFAADPELLKHLGPAQFEPSAARQLHAQISALTEPERVVFAKVIEQQGVLSEVLDQQPDEAAKKRLLEAVLAWSAWKDPVGGRLAQEEHKTLKNQALLARLGLSVGSTRVTPATVSSPADGTAPMRWSLMGVQGGAQGSQVQMSWAPAHFEAGGFNALEGGELKMAEVALGWSPGQAPRVQQATAISVLRIPLSERSLPGEQEWVWAIRLGAHRRAEAPSEAASSGPAMRTGVELGWGKGWRWGRTATAYAVVQAEASGREVGVLPRLGLHWNLTPTWHLVADWRPNCRVPNARAGCSQAEMLWRVSDQQVLRWGLTGGANGMRAFLGMDWTQ